MDKLLSYSTTQNSQTNTKTTQPTSITKKPPLIITSPSKTPSTTSTPQSTTQTSSSTTSTKITSTTSTPQSTPPSSSSPPPSSQSPPPSSPPPSSSASSSSSLKSNTPPSSTTSTTNETQSPSPTNNLTNNNVTPTSNEQEKSPPKEQDQNILKKLISSCLPSQTESNKLKPLECSIKDNKEEIENSNKIISSYLMFHDLYKKPPCIIHQIFNFVCDNILQTDSNSLNAQTTGLDLCSNPCEKSHPKLVNEEDWKILEKIFDQQTVHLFKKVNIKQPQHVCLNHTNFLITCNNNKTCMLTPSLQNYGAYINHVTQTFILVIKELKTTEINYNLIKLTPFMDFKGEIIEETGSCLICGHICKYTTENRYHRRTCSLQHPNFDISNGTLYNNRNFTNCDIKVGTKNLKRTENQTNRRLTSQSSDFSELISSKPIFNSYSAERIFFATATQVNLKRNTIKDKPTEVILQGTNYKDTILILTEYAGLTANLHYYNYIKDTPFEKEYIEIFIKPYIGMQIPKTILNIKDPKDLEFITLENIDLTKFDLKNHIIKAHNLRIIYPAKTKNKNKKETKNKIQQNNFNITTSNENETTEDMIIDEK